MTERNAGSRWNRERAKGVFVTAWGAGLLSGWLASLVDPPKALRIVFAVVYAGVLSSSGVAWLVFAAQDGALARALPAYARAGLALVVIALTCALAALVVTVVVGEEVTVDRVSTGAAIGTAAVLGAFWLTQAFRKRRPARPGPRN